MDLNEERKVGIVNRVLGEYGFVACDDYPDEGLYFKTHWFRGEPALQEGEAVSFQVKTYGDNRQAHHLLRIDPPMESEPATGGEPATRPTSNDRKVGTITRILGDYGFIDCADYPGSGIYFKTAWVEDNLPVQEGDEVLFQLKQFGENLQAHYLRLQGSSPMAERALDLRPRSDWLFDWAYLGYLPSTLSDLKDMALPERWEFKNQPADPDRPHPILFSYLVYTFGRLVLEGKVLVNEQANLAALNTGLVDRRYEEIYALFGPNDDPRAHWRLSGFCIAGEGPHGQNLVRYFKPKPQKAHYFDNPSDLLYDVEKGGQPELSWDHIIIDNISRFPREFIEDHCPSNFVLQDASSMDDAARRDYFQQLGSAISNDHRTYRSIMNRLKDALDLSVKRVSWNFKTAIPQYYPRVKKLTLLLPICLVLDEKVDMALAVEKTPSGSYLGHTVLPLDWAYRNARLICRPDSDWLDPEEITEGVAEEDDDS